MTAPQPPHIPEYLDMELEIGEGRGREYPVAVVRSPAGESRDTMRFPFDRLALDGHLKTIELALLRSSTRSRRVGSSDAQGVQVFGQALLDNLLTGPLRTSFEGSLMQAKQSGQRLRLRLRVQDPELAALPWEFLFDARQGEYLALSRSLSVVRYIELPSPVASLSITPPLRILAMASGPSDLPSLDATNEKQRMAAAVSSLVEAGIVEVTWLESGTWRELQRAMRAGPWHIFHFIGHGGFSAAADEGLLVLVGDDGKAQYLSATDVGRLLADHPTLRLVVLNSCQGAEGSRTDLHSSTATSLVQRGIPAVIAMQYEITDDAAIEFSRSLYEALADELPVDAAVTEARIAVSVALRGSLEWGTPVLLMRATEGALFRLGTQRGRRRRAVTGSTPAVQPPIGMRPAIEPMAAVNANFVASPVVGAGAVAQGASAFEAVPATPLSSASSGGDATRGSAAGPVTQSARQPRSKLPFVLAGGAAAVVIGVGALVLALAGGSKSTPRTAVQGVAAVTGAAPVAAIASPAAVTAPSGTVTAIGTPPPAAAIVSTPSAGAALPLGTVPPPDLSAPVESDRSRPHPKLEVVTSSNVARAGQPFTFIVTGRNATGAAAGNGTISVSSPDETAMTGVLQQGSCSITTKEHQYQAGEPIENFTLDSTGLYVPNAQVDATAPLVEAEEPSTWTSGTPCTLDVFVQNLRAGPGGVARFYLRMAMEITNTSQYVNWPSASPHQDQQDFPAVEWDVPVAVAP